MFPCIRVCRYVSQRLSLSLQLPPLDYLTFFDKYIFCIYICVLIQLLSSFGVAFLFRRETSLPGNIPRRVSRGGEVIRNVRLRGVCQTEKSVESGVDEEFILTKWDHIFTVSTCDIHRRERDAGKIAKTVAASRGGVL